MIRALTVLMATALASNLPAQFDSGSSGASGELVVESDTVLAVPENGLFEFTSVTVSPGATLSFERGINLPPVTFLVSGDVLIEGNVDLTGESSSDSSENSTPAAVTLPGPGGFPGGIGGAAVVNVFTRGRSGDGPGGGAAASGATNTSGSLAAGGDSGSHFTSGETGSFNIRPPGPTYGDARLLTLTGGSGGAGSDCFADRPGLNGAQSGGAGGGAIAILSSGVITVNGVITANGGSGGGLEANQHRTHGSGSGAGGAIRLVANELLGTGSLLSIGGGVGGSAPDGGDGRIVLEAFNISQDLRVNCDPPPGAGLPTIVGFDPAELPSVRIVNLGGMPIPDPPGGSLIDPDVAFGGAPSMLVAEMETVNVPDGATVDLRVTLSSGAIVQVESNPVTANAATATIELPPDAGVGIISPTIDFND